MSQITAGALGVTQIGQGLGSVTEAKGDNNNPALFKDALNKANLDQIKKSPKAALNPDLVFSNHAVERMTSRGINFEPEKLAKITEAVGKARAKGAQETLVLTDQAALIVSVKNNKVVTVMDSQSLKENVFTNIDSTVML